MNASRERILYSGRHWQLCVLVVYELIFQYVEVSDKMTVFLTIILVKWIELNPLDYDKGVWEMRRGDFRMKCERGLSTVIICMYVQVNVIT